MSFNADLCRGGEPKPLYHRLRRVWTPAAIAVGTIALGALLCTVFGRLTPSFGESTDVALSVAMMLIGAAMLAWPILSLWSELRSDRDRDACVDPE